MSLHSSGLKMNSPSASNHIVPSHNPIQLAAISNYKLAQLTFAPPDLHSLRKTAVIKNMIQNIYTSIPAEWLQQMTRWSYFTPESLEEMTQEGLEEIFAQYAQTIEAFRPIKPNNNSYQYDDNELFDDQDDGKGDDLWIAEDDHHHHHQQSQSMLPVTMVTEEQRSESTTLSIFSQPNATLSNESLEFPIRSPSPLSEKPLPANPIINDDTAKQARRKSGFSGNKNRLSWTSDTGITSSVVSQNLANEIMSLFDMDFAIDIKVDTAPKLPELPFKPQRISQHRKSQDMLTSLIPAFEKIALENSTDEFDEFIVFQQQQQLQQQLQQKAHSQVHLQAQKFRPNLVIKSVPQRSSSLKNRQLNNSPISPPATPDSSFSIPIEKTLSKKKSILRLASLMTAKKNSHKDLPNSPEPSPIQHQQRDTTRRKTSTSTVDSSSSAWSFVSDSNNVLLTRPQKPLPEPPGSPDFFQLTDDSDYNKKNRATNSRRPSAKKKRRSVMEKTMSKRKSNLGLQSIYDASLIQLENEDKSTTIAGLSRSKSAFIKIGNGLKTKKQLKQIRRTSSAKTLIDNNNEQIHHYKVNNIYTGTEEKITSTTSFVKRMTSFNWRMKSRSSKPVAV